MSLLPVPTRLDAPEPAVQAALGTASARREIGWIALCPSHPARECRRWRGVMRPGPRPFSRQPRRPRQRRRCRFGRGRGRSGLCRLAGPPLSRQPRRDRRVAAASAGAGEADLPGLRPVRLWALPRRARKPHGSPSTSRRSFRCHPPRRWRWPLPALARPDGLGPMTGGGPGCRVGPGRGEWSAAVFPPARFHARGGRGLIRQGLRRGRRPLQFGAGCPADPVVLAGCGPRRCYNLPSRRRTAVESRRPTRSP